MGKIIYTDIDLTVLNFNQSFEQYLRDNGYDIPRGILHGHCHLPNAVPDIGEVETRALVNDFFSHDSFDEIPALDHAAEAFQELSRNGWEFVGISACPEHVGANRRKKNLEDQLGVRFNEVFLSGLTDCKGEYLSRFNPTVWVEDNVSHAEVGIDLGYRTYLIDQLHNRNKTTRANRVIDWREIVGDLCTEA